MPTITFSSTNAKQTAAYLKRRSARLLKKAKFSKDSGSRSSLIHMSERAAIKANELYYNC